MRSPFAQLGAKSRAKAGTLDGRARDALARLRAEEAAGDQVGGERASCVTLGAFLRAAWPIIEPSTPFLANWHQEAICEYLEAVTAGQITRLLINLPPRYMKSITVSIMWPCWEWTKSPHRRWMFASYSGMLSNDHAMARRAILQSAWYQRLWGDHVRLTNDLVTDLRNDRKGYLFATSFGAAATGRGGNRVVIDDPHSPKKALSDVERAADLREFDHTFSNRLNDKRRDALVVVMQRLHHEDIAARCLELGYTHLCLPAVSEGRTVISLPSGRTVTREDGELLWPGREGHAEIEAAKLSMGEYAFAGQYQQRPSPLLGGMFPATWPILPACPPLERTVRYWDKAGTQGGGAYTAGVLLGRTLETPPRYVIADVVRGQWSASVRERIIKDTAGMDGPGVRVYVEREPGSGGKESAENTVINLAGFAVEADLVTGDKVTRAAPLAAQAQVGNVYLVKADWNKAFIDEARMFPMGKYKDQVDAAGGAFNKVVLSPVPGPSRAAGGRPALRGMPDPGMIPGR